MLDLPNSKKDYYETLSKEELITFLLNSDYRIENIEEKLYMLTGCGCYGDCDGMNGSCVDCDINNPELRKRCSEFQDKILKKRRMERLQTKNNTGIKPGI